MSLPVGLRPEALDDVFLAREWYERQSPGLGDTFAATVEQLLERISAMPELYAATFRGVRAAKLRRFPYVVYYRILTDRIEVHAVLHGSRDARGWKKRS